MMGANGPAADDDAVGGEMDVAIVGGGPAGATAGIFTARYGLDTIVFDRGNSSLRRCAHLENYPGFPGGIDVERFYALLGDQLAVAGAEHEHDMVVNVVNTGTTETGFRVETQDGRAVRARRVVCATTYDGDYLRDLDDEDTLFRTREHHGETEEIVDWSYADVDGRTPIRGLYFAGAIAGRGEQAVIAAGHGAAVARTLLADARADDGYWDEVRGYYDWLRRRESVDYNWDDEATWRERFADHNLPENEHDLDVERVERVRARELDTVRDAHITRAEAARRDEDGQRRLVRRLDTAVVLDELDDDVLRDYVRKHDLVT